MAAWASSDKMLLFEQDIFPDPSRLSLTMHSASSSELHLSNAWEPEAQDLDLHQQEERPNKGGRPPKKWPMAYQRLLARFVTTTFPSLTFVGHAVKENGFAVR